MLKKGYKLAVEFGLISVLFLIGIYAFSNTDLWTVEFFKNFVIDNPYLSLFVYYIVFVVLSLLGVSVTPLLIMGGVAFGLEKGFFIGFISLYTSSICAFYLSKIVSHKLVVKHHPNFKFKIVTKVIKKVEDTIETHPFRTIFYTKFFIANIIVSYALGVISDKVDLKKFFIATFANNFTYSFILIFTGDKFIDNPVYMSIILIAILSYYIVKYNFKKAYLKHKVV